MTGKELEPVVDAEIVETGGGEVRPHEPVNRMEELEVEMMEVAAEVQRLTAVDDSPESTGTDLVHIGQSAPQTKRELARRAQTAAQLRARGKAIAKQMQEEMEKRTREAMEIIDPLKAMIKQLEEGIWTINLYLGRDEQITTLRKGATAPQGTPIQIRQLVLSMDEETAITEDKGLDFKDVTTFDDWLLKDPAHLDQVLPEEKGIVAIRPRAEETKESRRSYWREEAEKRDKHTYFLIRNGESLYRLWTDFSIGDRMVPDAREFERIFRTTKRNFDWDKEDEVYTLQPGDRGYDEAAEEAAYRERDYTRMGLILQGLAERTAVFHPLPPEGLNFLDGSSTERGDVIFVRDAERTMGKGEEDFDSWLARVNGELQVGMRIIGSFHEYGGAFSDANENSREGSHRYGHSRLRPEKAGHPSDTEAHVLDARHREGWTFKYRRPDKNYGHHRRADGSYGWGEYDYKTRASCYVTPRDKFILAIDTTDRGQMEAFLRDRIQRHHYLKMFPLLTRAIAFKRAEEEAEAPFLDLLRGELMKIGASPEEADRQIPGLTRWWKLKNKEHRALVGTDDAKALTEIVAEYAKRKRLDETATSPELLAQMQADHPDALLIARRPDGYHVVLDPEDPNEDVWVRQTAYTKTGKVRQADTERWRLVPRTVPSWRVFYESPRWKGWKRTASRSEHLTGPEMEAAAEWLRENVGPNKSGNGMVAIAYDRADKHFEVWDAEKIEVPRKPRLDFHFRDRHWLSREYRWVRKDGEVKLHHRGSYHDHSYTGTAPWVADVEQERFMGRSRRSPKTLVTLWTDEKLIHRTNVRFEAAEQIKEAAVELRERIGRIEHRLIAQLKEAEEQRRHDEFMAEYGDETLWEGHRKTLKKIEVYPRDVPTEWLHKLIEDEVDIDGKTVAQVAALAGEESTWLTKWGHLTIDGSPWPERDDDDDWDEDDED